MYRLILILFFYVTSCTNPPYRGKDVLGADEFVMDSYKIREGKFAVLEMEGRSFEELSSELLDEYQDEIHEGDVLQVAVYHPNRSDIAASVQSIGSTVGYRISEGKIILPDLLPVEVQGLTLEQARQKIEEQYREQIQKLDHQFEDLSKIKNTLSSISKSMEAKTTYKVKTGDSLEKIAKRHHLSVQKLKQANHLETDRIVVGQELFLPNE